jgi:hypothetical protein
VSLIERNYAGHRWTTRACPEHIGAVMRPECAVCGRPGEKVEVVLAPDKVAIERGAKATWDYDEEVYRRYVETIPVRVRDPKFADGYTPRPWEDAEPDERKEYLERFRAGLRAALGDSDGPEERCESIAVTKIIHRGGGQSIYVQEGRERAHCDRHQHYWDGCSYCEDAEDGDGS